MRSPVDQIKERLGIVEVVSNYLKLEKAGANLKGKCPFHNEKTPSFFVSPSRNTYYCFGCNAKGDIFSFIQEFEKVDFKGALKVLAERAGVVLPEFNPKDAKEKDILIDINEEAGKFFEDQLKENKKVYQYLLDRGLKKETILEWRIGFAPSTWHSLKNHLIQKKFNEKDIEKVGLIKMGPKEAYDRFRGRIMFPIFDPGGRVVAFSGRLFESTPSEKVNSQDSKTEAKYINTPETSLFVKSQILFGYHKAKNFIRQKKFTLLVEGQIDLIMAHQAGLSQTIATSGTALTLDQLLIIKRLSPNLMIAYDGDKAGINASKRAFALALSQGFDVKVAPLPSGKDPGDLIKENPEEFKNILRKSLHIIDFSLEQTLRKKLEGRALLKEMKENVLPYVNSTASPTERAYFVSKIAEIIKVPEEAIYAELELIKDQAIKEPFRSNYQEEQKKISKKEQIERKLAGLYFNEPPENLSVMENKFQRLFEDMPALSISSLAKSYEKEKEVLLFEVEKDLEDEKKEKYFNDICLNFKKEILKAELDQAASNLKKAEKEGNSSEIQKLLRACSELTKRLSYLKM